MCTAVAEGLIGQDIYCVVYYEIKMEEVKRRHCQIKRYLILSHFSLSVVDTLSFVHSVYVHSHHDLDLLCQAAILFLQQGSPPFNLPLVFPPHSF